MRRKRARFALCSAALPLLALTFALSASSSIAGADTVQDNPCFTNAGDGFSRTFVVPITATATPDAVTVPDPITLSGVSISISVDSALIAAGIAVGVVSAALDEGAGTNGLRNIGFVDNAGAPNPNAGISTVTLAPGAATLKIAGTNTVEGEQTATNLSTITVMFYVTAQADGSDPQVYTSVTNGTAGQGGPNDTRTGTPLVGDLVVPVALDGHKVGTTDTAGDTLWTPLGGDVTFSEVNSAPDNPLTPSIASQNAAPLVLKTKINGFVIVNFFCWPGTLDETQDPPPFVDGLSNTIDSVAVTGGVVPTTTTTTVAPTTTTTAEPTTTTTVDPNYPPVTLTTEGMTFVGDADALTDAVLASQSRGLPRTGTDFAVLGWCAGALAATLILFATRHRRRPTRS